MLLAGGMDEMDAVARMELQPGWDVYDADGTHVGTVDEVGAESFTMRSSGPVDMTIGVDFASIESADDGRVELQVTAEELNPANDGSA